jgi:hypothetical protein
MAEGMEAGGGGNALPRRAGVPQLTLGSCATHVCGMARGGLPPSAPPTLL